MSECLGCARAPVGGTARCCARSVCRERQSGATPCNLAGAGNMSVLGQAPVSGHQRYPESVPSVKLKDAARMCVTPRRCADRSRDRLGPYVDLETMHTKTRRESRSPCHWITYYMLYLSHDGSSPALPPALSNSSRDGSDRILEDP